jgi:molecular chaperone GrpE (heat shock protein)
MDETQPNPAEEAEQSGAPDPALLKLIESGQGVSVSAITTAIVRGEMIKLIRSLTKAQNDLESLTYAQHNHQRGFLTQLVEVADSLDRMIRYMNSTSELAEGLLALRTQLWQALGDEEVFPIEISIGEMFNPAVCEISQRVERADLALNTIVVIDRRGYTWQSKPFRRARVAISTRPAE